MTDYRCANADRARNGIVYRNRLLAQFEDDCSNHLTAVQLRSGQVLFHQGAALQHVYFLEAGLVSLFGEAGNGTGAHVAMIGAEGSVGLLEVFLASRVAIGTAVVQVRGEAFRMAVQDAARLFAGAANLGAALDAVQALIRQLMQNAAANARDSIMQRLALLLHSARVRLSTNEIPMTQGVISTMLNAHRPSVTLAIGELQLDGVVQANRGRITVLDADELARRATSWMRRQPLRR